MIGQLMDAALASDEPIYGVRLEFDLAKGFPLVHELDEPKTLLIDSAECGALSYLREVIRRIREGGTRVDIDPNGSPTFWPLVDAMRVTCDANDLSVAVRCLEVTSFDEMTYTIVELSLLLSALAQVTGRRARWVRVAVGTLDVGPKAAAASDTLVVTA